MSVSESWVVRVPQALLDALSRRVLLLNLPPPATSESQSRTSGEFADLAGQPVPSVDWEPRDTGASGPQVESCGPDGNVFFPAYFQATQFSLLC